MKSYKYILEGLDCPNCAKKIEKEIAKMEGYEDVAINFSTLKLTLKTDKQNPKKEIIKVVQSIEPEVKILEEGDSKAEHKNSDILRIVIGLAIYIIAMISNFNMICRNIMIIIAFIILLYRTTKKAFKQVVKNKVLDENTLIVISAVGAYLVGKVSEGLMVITLYEIGKILEARAVNKTRKSITSLMDIKPEYANIKNGEDVKEVNPEDVKIGDIIVVKAG